MSLDHDVRAVIAKLTSDSTPRKLGQGTLITIYGPMCAQKSGFGIELSHAIAEEVAGDPERAYGFLPQGTRPSDLREGRIYARDKQSIAGEDFPVDDFSFLAKLDPSIACLYLEELHLAGNPHRLYRKLWPVFNQGIDVVAVTLDHDWRGLPFESAKLFGRDADYAAKRTAECSVARGEESACQEPAEWTLKIVNGRIPGVDESEQLEAGDAILSGRTQYVPVCSDHLVFPSGFRDYCRSKGISLPPAYRSCLEGLQPDWLDKI